MYNVLSTLVAMTRLYEQGRDAHSMMIFNLVSTLQDGHYPIQDDIVKFSHVSESFIT